MQKVKCGVILQDKGNKCESIEVPIEEFIFNPYDITFIFPNYTDEPNDEPYEATLLYDDFLFYQDEYTVAIKIHP